MDMNKVIVIDCGSNRTTFFDSAKDTEGFITKEELFDLPNNLPAGFTIVSENAHLGTPRNKYSLAQPFTENELLNWYDRCEINGINVRLFPQQSTPRACKYSKREKSDSSDPKSIYLLLKDYPEISMMKPPTTFGISSKTQSFWDRKDRINKMVNLARNTKYDLHGYVGDKNTQFIVNNLEYIYDKLSDNAKSCFGFVEYKKAGLGRLKIKNKANWAFSMSQMYSILASITDFQGNFIDNNMKFPTNNDFWRHIVCASPFHFRGGIVRSTLYHHGARNWIMKMGKQNNLNFKRKVKLPWDKDKVTVSRGLFNEKEEKFFVEHRRLYNKAIKELYSLFKSMIREGMYEGIETENELEIA